jgi:predicted HAD superfamily Cof-like phosphohydrolase
LFQIDSEILARAAESAQEFTQSIRHEQANIVLEAQEREASQEQQMYTTLVPAKNATLTVCYFTQ